MLINALHALIILIDKKILMEIIMENVFVMMAIMMIIKIFYVNSALHFG